MFSLAGETDAGVTLADSRAIGIRDGAARLIRKSRPYAEAVDAANTQLYLPLDEGAASANPLDLSGNAWAGGITTNAGVENWRVIDGVPAFIPKQARRYTLSSFTAGSDNTFTFECMIWVHAEVTGAAGVTGARESLVGYGTTITTNRVTIWREENTGRIKATVVGVGGIAAAAYNVDLDQDSWNHIRLVIKPSDVKIFVNKVEGSTVSTVNHGFVGTVAQNLSVGYSEAQGNFTYACSIASVRVSNVERTGTESVPLFSRTVQTVRTGTIAIADLPNFSAITKIFIDQDLTSAASGASTGGSVQPEYNKDGAGWVSFGAANTTSGRLYASGLGITPTSTFALGARLIASGNVTYNPALLVTGGGFVYARGVPGAPVLGTPTASTASSVTLPITAAAGITDTVLHAIAPDNSQVSVTITTADVPAGATTSYAMTGLSADVLYRFIAHHRDADGFAGADSNVVTCRAAATFAGETAELPALTTPVFASSASIGTGSGVGFRWGAVTNASTYQVIVYDEGTLDRAASGTTASLSTTFGGLTEGFYEATVTARGIDTEVKSEPSDPVLVWLDDDGDTRTMTILKAVQARIQDNVAAFGDRVYLRPIGGVNAQLFKRAQGKAVCVVVAAGESADDGDHVEYLTTVRIVVGTAHEAVGDEFEDSLLGVGDRTASAELGVWALADQVAVLFHQHTLGQVVAGSFEIGKGADQQADDTKLVTRSIDVRILSLHASL